MDRESLRISVLYTTTVVKSIKDEGMATWEAQTWTSFAMGLFDGDVVSGAYQEPLIRKGPLADQVEDLPLPWPVVRLQWPSGPIRVAQLDCRRRFAGLPE